jgi:hypothetical protein
MSALLADLRFALRTLGRSPLFAAVAVLSLALGIGANTAIFTLLDQLVLRLLPVKDPEQLVMIWSRGTHVGSNTGSRALSYPMYQDFQQQAPAFSHVFCRYYTPLSISFEGTTERVNAELVSGNFFQSLGVGPAIGRVFSPDEDDRQYKAHPVVVLSHHYWVSRYAADPQVLGKKILVGRRLLRPRSRAVPAPPHPHPDEAAHDTRLGRARRPAVPLDSGVRADEAWLHHPVRAGLPRAAVQADPAPRGHPVRVQQCVAIHPGPVPRDDRERHSRRKRLLGIA